MPVLLVEFGGALGMVLAPEPVALGDTARKIKGECLESVRQALRACLARVSQWTERSRRMLAEVRYASPGTVRPEAVALRDAFGQAATGRTTAAADRLQQIVNERARRCGAGCGDRRPPTYNTFHHYRLDGRSPSACTPVSAATPATTSTRTAAGTCGTTTPPPPPLRNDYDRFIDDVSWGRHRGGRH